VSDPLLVVDLEATCWSEQDPARPAPPEGCRYANEIIEIGALLVETARWTPLRSFQTFVRPVDHPVLTPFCTGLTHITQAQVDGAPAFPAALTAFLAAFRLAPGAVFTWGSWGRYDLLQLRSDCRRHGLPDPLANARHRNLKEEAAAALGLRPRGIAGTLAHLGHPFDGVQHRALEDVRNIVRIFRQLTAHTPTLATH